MKRYLAGSTLGQMLITAKEMNGLFGGIAKLESLPSSANDILSRRIRNALCRNDMIFVDVGCHIGSVIGGVKACSKPGQIIAVEAVPSKADYLRKRFPCVAIHQCAVGPANGNVEFTVSLERSGYSSLDPKVRDMGAFEIISVPMRRLDDILPHAGVDVVKIDIEGAELGALIGGEQVITVSRPTIVFESSGQEMEGYPIAALFAWFQDHGYEIVAPNRVAHTAPPMSLDAFVDAHHYPRLSHDYFAIATERRKEIRDRAREILGVAA